MTVEVWTARLDEPPGAAADDLSPEDRRRAGAYLRPEVARAWIASRSALRRVLAFYIDQPPAEIGLETGANGKPRVMGDAELEFNLSHSGELALIAVSRSRPVGVDVERIAPGRDLLELAERALDRAVVEEIRETVPAERPAVFYDAWVRHEARLKCLGSGLTGAPPAGAVAIAGLDVPSGYAAAVAVAGTEVGKVRHRVLRRD